MARILVGTCSWTDHTDFYPSSVRPADRLEYYARHFPIVEVDSTFYHLQPARNFARWAERTPEGFVFNVKAYRELTWHDREVPPSVETFERFSAAIQPLRDAGKLGCVHFQFPPWFVRRPENFDYLSTLPEFFPGDLVGVEFRHRSWLEADQVEATLRFLREHELVYTMVDEPQLGSGTVPPIAAATHSALAIVRFHGRNRQMWYAKVANTGERFNYLYTPEELAGWLPKIEDVSRQVREVHLLTNNNRANYAVRNAKDLQRLLGQMPLPLEVEPTGEAE